MSQKKWTPSPFVAAAIAMAMKEQETAAAAAAAASAASLAKTKEDLQPSKMILNEDDLLNANMTLKEWDKRDNVEKKEDLKEEKEEELINLGLKYH